MLTNTTSLVLTAITLVAAFVFPPMAAYTAVYVSLCAMLLAGGAYWRQVARISREPAYLLVALAYVLFASTLPFTWRGTDDLLILVALTPVAFGLGLVLLLEAEPRFNSLLVFGSICLAGAISAVFVGLGDVYLSALPRAGGGNNPIHFAHLASTLGFLALVGFFGTSSRWRFMYLAGPVAGFQAILLSETRGAMLGYVAVAFCLLPFFAAWFARSRIMWLAMAAALVLIGASVVISPQSLDRPTDAVVTSYAAIHHLLFEADQGAVPSDIDRSTDKRLAMIRATGQAFMSKPFFGYGAGQIISTAQQFYPERYKDMGNHLHSDMADFVVAGGVFGLVGYFCLLAAPFAVFYSIRDLTIRRPILVGAMALSGSFFFNGLTNAVFGILPQTALFGTALAFLIAIGRYAREQKTWMNR